MPAGSGSESFCCAGCRAAWEVLHACGLERFYTLPERRLAAVAPSGRTFEEFDHEAFQRLHTRARPDGAREIDFYLEGIHCASCVWLIERLPRMVPGLARVELDLGRRLARVSWDPGRVPLSRVARALDSLGYRPHPFRGGRGDAVRRAEDRAMLGRLGLAAALASNVMLLAVALYAGGFKGMEARFEHYFRWLSLGLTTVSVLGPGRTFFRGALSSFRARALHMDVPARGRSTSTAWRCWCSCSWSGDTCCSARSGDRRTRPRCSARSRHRRRAWSKAVPCARPRPRRCCPAWWSKCAAARRCPPTGWSSRAARRSIGRS
jgi:Cu2+-exporting ATPase